jgi:glutamyl-tRNA(Gln) amidotransferase subunit E
MQNKSQEKPQKDQFDPQENYQKSQVKVGYVKRKDANQATYDSLGFMSGLEVHQQLLTKKKLFCHCPAGLYNKSDDYDAEVVRHMRPTLSELGEYDGTALMEFKTRKEIVYRLKHETTCTYEVDDTPPFPIDREALDNAIVISLLSKLNIVGEVHITRKQYLDGSIPTGFQRTAIIGVEGELQLKNKKIRLIQLSLEEDSCREVSDIGHTRIYRTDRLGMPLIETVTYPDMVNPDEVKEVCDYIRFLNRSTGRVRTGIGAGRQDVNVSCKGGTRVEIKGVAHTKWIPELTHNECFRQWALLQIKDELLKRIEKPEAWKLTHEYLRFHSFKFSYKPIKEAKKQLHKIVAVNLPNFKGILSHFTQPGKMFTDEIAERLKVIACLEHPNISHSESLERQISKKDFAQIKEILNAGENDAQIIFWGPEADIKTALETIEERCKMAFEGVPNETRKSFENGTTIFERVLPGADRMYPDTDSAPIPLENEHIEKLGENLPSDIIDRYHQLKEWDVPEDNYTFIFKKNLFVLMQSIIEDLKINPRFLGSFLGQNLKYVEGHVKPADAFDYQILYAMFKFLNKKKIKVDLAKLMIPVVYEHPKMDFESVLEIINYKKVSAENIYSHILFLKEKFAEIGIKKEAEKECNWIMGELRSVAIGNIDLSDLAKRIKGS